MIRQPLSAADPLQATSSRRERSARRIPGPAGMRAERQMQRILHRSDVALRETHWNVIRAVQRIFANPERSTAQFVAAGERLARIAEWLDRAGACYRQILELAVLESESAAEVPDILASEALHILAVGKHLADVSDRLAE